MRTSATHVDIVAKTLERKDSGLASYIPVGDMGLYAEHPLTHDKHDRGEERKLPIKGTSSGVSDRANWSLSAKACSGLTKSGKKVRDTCPERGRCETLGIPQDERTYL